MKDLTKVITPGWTAQLNDELCKPYFKKIINFLKKEEQAGEIIYPEKENIFRALSLVDFEAVKIVIIGQDPYHGPQQANSFAFAVNLGIKHPPSLKNIFKEIANDLGTALPVNSSLLGWAQQGVLMLNCVLTVRKDSLSSHKDLGWQTFTDKIIECLDKRPDPVIFILWGNYAQTKESLILNKKHFILKAPHPSPFSVHKGFFGCKHFSKANELLQAFGKKPIDWTSS